MTFPVDIDEKIESWLSAYAGPDAAVATLLCDRHVPTDPALTVVQPDLRARTYSFAGLGDMSGRVARVLGGLGVEPGDRVATLLGEGLELVASLLGIWRLGAVAVPISTACERAAIAHRLDGSEVKAVVTDSANRAALDPTPGRKILTAGGGPLGDVDFWQAVDAACDPVTGAVARGGSEPFIRFYAPVTDERPDAVDVPVRALASIQTAACAGIGLEAGDVYWNAGNPGSAFGLYSGIVGPLLLGLPPLLLAAPFDAELAGRVVRELGVTNFTAPPGVYGVLYAARERVAFSGPRVLSMAGRPMEQDVAEWAEGSLGAPMRYHLGQTETGMLLADGRPLPGLRIAVLGEGDVEAPAGTRGRMAVDVPASPLFWFQGYDGAPERTAKRFTPDRRYFLTDMVAVRGEDGRLRITWEPGG
jgi:acetyl-CoA synthetase